MRLSHESLRRYLDRVAYASIVLDSAISVVSYTQYAGLLKLLGIILSAITSLFFIILALFIPKRLRLWYDR